MKSYEFFGRLLLRVPRFNKGSLNMSLQELLDNPVFRDAVYLASDSLYEELRKRNFQATDCNERAQLALKKYHHRICYRSTPFGAFASLSQIEWGAEEVQTPLHIVQDSFCTLLLEHQGTENQHEETGLYQVNPALYSFGSNYRLYEGVERNEKSERIFKVNELHGDDLPSMIINERGHFSHHTLVETLLRSGLMPEETVGFINELLESRSLLKICYKPVPKLSLLMPGKIRNDKGAGLYAHTSHRTSGTVNMQVQDKIRDGIHALEHLFIPEADSDLERFKKRFVNFFDQREVPLLLALDPEGGIDYGSNTAWRNASGKVKPDRSATLAWSKVHEVLLRKWTAHSGSGLPEIRLDEEDLQELEPAAEGHAAPGMMVLFSMIPGGIQIHAAGGVSGLNMLGRFTIFDDELLAMAKEISRLEQEANPEVVFAEVLHDHDKVADKLNLRSDFRDYVIPVLTGGDRTEEHCIELNDLSISVSGGKLILWSQRLNRRVIPRLGTAYNHRRNVFSVYRFLCELQNEDSQPSLGLSMSALFPGLPFYPAVYYKGVLLEAASWRIKGSVFKSLIKGKPESSPGAIHDLAKELHLPELFMYEQQDQRLLIRRDSPEDIRLLLKTVKDKSSVVLREYHEDKEGLVRDQAGEAFAHELVAFLVKKNRTYFDVLHFGPGIHEGNFGLFEEWLYIKVYMHPYGMDYFLLSNLIPFIDRCSMKLSAVKWFFIRYMDPDDHLRVRIKCRKDDEMLLLNELRTFLSEIQRLPNVRSVQFAAYEREVQRYAPIGIVAAEDFFCLSTTIALESLAANYTNTSSSDGSEQLSYKIAADFAGALLVLGFQYTQLIEGVIHMYSVFRNCGFSSAQIVGLSLMIYKRLFKKLHIGKDLKLQFDREYRSMADAMIDGINHQSSSAKSSHSYLGSLAEKVILLDQDAKVRVLLDLNHMHLNRLFTDAPNLNEAHCYYYLYKIALRKVMTG